MTDDDALAEYIAERRDVPLDFARELVEEYSRDELVGHRDDDYWAGGVLTPAEYEEFTVRDNGDSTSIRPFTGRDANVEWSGKPSEGFVKGNVGIPGDGETDQWRIPFDHCPHPDPFDHDYYGVDGLDRYDHRISRGPNENGVVIHFPNEVPPPDCHHAATIIFRNEAPGEGDTAPAADTDTSDGITVNGGSTPGPVTASGDGTTTTFTVRHDRGKTPDPVQVAAKTPDAQGEFFIASLDSETFDIVYATPPPSGRQNLTWTIGYGDAARQVQKHRRHPTPDVETETND